MMTKEQVLAHLRRLPLDDRRRVLLMAQVIRAARDAGDDRATSEIIAPALAQTAQNA